MLRNHQPPKPPSMPALKMTGRTRSPGSGRSQRHLNPLNHSDRHPHRVIAAATQMQPGTWWAPGRRGPPRPRGTRAAIDNLRLTQTDDKVKLSIVEGVDIGALANAVRERAVGEPLDRVEAAMAVSEELASGADDLIGQFVAEARQAGGSWTEIGQRIGVSKQAAPQRLAQAPPAPAAGDTGMKRDPRLLACPGQGGRGAG